MNTHADKTQENKSQSVANTVYQKKSGGEATFQFVDNRPEAIAQRNLQEMANNNPRAKKAAQLQAMADNYSARQQHPIQKKENNTGLPDNLKTGMESLSGMSLDDVKVHRNSDKPAQLQAHAYAKGTDIHLGSGQEKHLPHEAWHVVQQKQGRVKPTMQMKGKVNVNDDSGLEKEADVMGSKALQMQINIKDSLQYPRISAQPLKSSVIQGLFYEYVKDDLNIYHYGPVINAIWAPKLNADGQQEKADDGTGIWLRKTSREYVEQIVAQDERIRDAHQGFRQAIDAINIGDLNREQVIERLQATHDIATRYLEELKGTLSKYAILGVLGVGASVGAVVIAEHFLSLPNIPWGIKAAIDIAGVLYGAYVSIRWLQSTILPKLTSLLMAAANTTVWAATLYPLLTEIASGQAFASVHIAALPLAISLEVLMRKLDAKVREMGEAQPLLGN
jgi:hypothetical protein